MKKIIAKKEYDTESSELVKKVTHGEVGDTCGFEESLYKTPDGSYFLYTNGGSESKYTSESIKRMSRAAAEAWLSENE